MVHICEQDQKDAHFFLNNLFKLNYPRHVSNKYLFIIRRSVQATCNILLFIIMTSLNADTIWLIACRGTRLFIRCKVNTVSYLYRPSGDEQIFVRNMSRMNELKYIINRLTPNDPRMGRTAPLTSKRCILYIYSTNIGTEYFKHALYSPFFSLKMQFFS